MPKILLKKETSKSRFLACGWLWGCNAVMELIFTLCGCLSVVVLDSLAKE